MIKQDSETVFEFGPFRLDTAQGVLFREGEPVRLAPKEIETLRVLVGNAGRLVSKEEIIAKVWPDAFVSDDSLTRCVYVVRKALGEEQNGQQYIETLARRGYRFVAPVDVAPQVATPTVQPAAPADQRASAAPTVATLHEPTLQLPQSRKADVGSRILTLALVAAGLVACARRSGVANSTTVKATGADGV